MKSTTYANNYNKLLKYAEGQGITVIYSKTPADANWNKQNKTISISHHYSGEIKELAFLLHELGHSRDDFSHTKEQVEYLDLCYNKFNKIIMGNKIRLNNKIKDEVINTEYRAWKNGIDIAKSLNIRLGKWYFTEMKDSLLNYFEYAYPKSFKQKYEEFLNE